MTAVLSPKGQITLPKALRDKLGLAPGTVLEFAAEDGGRLVARKKPVEDDPFTRWRGKGRLPVGKTVDEYLDIIRGR